jgi:hypothetical protein
MTHVKMPAWGESLTHVTMPLWRGAGLKLLDIFRWSETDACN